MSYCLNPQCQKTTLEDNASNCTSCGTKLVLGDPEGASRLHRHRYRALKLIGQGGFGRT